MNLHNISPIALDIAREAGTLLREGYFAADAPHKTIELKSSSMDLVTQYDKAAETLIVGRLRAAFPDHRIVAEEGSNNSNDSPYLWLVDPLDGTTNFAHGFPVFAVSIALLDNGQPCLGIVYDPIRDECFAAIAGQGATLTRADGLTQTLQVSAAASLQESLLATGFPYDVQTSDWDNLAEFRAFVKRSRGVRRPGAAALDLAYVAAGRLDGYWEYKLSPWDIAAGILLVREAGGRVTSIPTGPVTLEGQIHLIASNGRLHEEMAGVLHMLNE
ncbi:MAG: inositol monophosphatase [Anaerolineae bacterium]|nr:inositol monophosphatase [Anaerolineae bacterium]